MRRRVLSWFAAGALAGVGLLGILNTAMAAPISFSDAIHQILERSTQIGVQRQSYLSLKAANVPNRLYYLPTLNADAKRVVTGYPDGGGIERADQADVRADLNIFRFGADYELYKASENNEKQQDSTVQYTVLQVEDQAVRALTTMIQRRRELVVYQDQAKIKQEAYDIALQRYHRGLLAEQEMRKSQVDLDNALASAAEAKFLVYDSEATVKDLLGSTDVDDTWPWKERLSSMNIESYVQKFKLDVSQRPDWAAAEYHVLAQRNLSSRNYRLMLPSIDANFTYGYYHYEEVNSFIPSGGQWQATLGVTLPLFDHLVNLSNARSQAYLAAQAEIQKVEVQRTALSQFESAKDSLVTAVKSAKERENTLSVSRTLYQDSLKRFQAGRTDSNELLIDQSRLLDSERLAVAGWAEAHIALSKFCHELGKSLASCGF